MSDLISRDEELVQLRAENARIDEELVLLRAENARLRHQEEAQVGMVRVLAPENRAVMPDAEELRGLFAAVSKRWPKDFADVAPEMFGRAFFALSTIHRSPEIDQSHYCWHWLAIARERGRGDVNLPAFLAAACAWSDIEMVDFRLENEGVLPAFALNEYCGRLPTDQWRATLAGRFVQPVDPRPRQRVGDGRTPRPSILVDGRELPNEQRFAGFVAGVL